MLVYQFIQVFKYILLLWLKALPKAIFIFLDAAPCILDHGVGRQTVSAGIARSETFAGGRQRRGDTTGFIEDSQA